jgi:hypothetical protein
VLEILDGFGDGGEHVGELGAEPFDFGVHHIVVHLPSALLVDQIVVDVCFLRKALHGEAELLLVEEFSDIGDVGAQVMPAVLLLEQASRTGEAFGALGVRAEVFDRFGGVLGAGHLVVQLIGLLLLSAWLLHQLSYNLLLSINEWVPGFSGGKGAT